MFNTNKTLEQKVKASMATSLHFIELSIIIRPSEPHIGYIAELTPALSGFTTAFKAALNERNTTGHRVAYIIMTGLIHPQRQKEKCFAFILRSTGSAVSAVGAIAQALRRAHQSRSLHSLTKH